jgi:hypothetical protein
VCDDLIFEDVAEEDLDFAYTLFMSSILSLKLLAKPVNLSRWKIVKSPRPFELERLS